MGPREVAEKEVFMHGNKATISTRSRSTQLCARRVTLDVKGIYGEDLPLPRACPYTPENHLMFGSQTSAAQNWPTAKTKASEGSLILCPPSLCGCREELRGRPRGGFLVQAPTFTLISPLKSKDQRYVLVLK